MFGEFKMRRTEIESIWFILGALLSQVEIRL